MIKQISRQRYRHKKKGSFYYDKKVTASGCNKKNKYVGTGQSFKTHEAKLDRINRDIDNSTITDFNIALSAMGTVVELQNKQTETVRIQTIQTILSTTLT